MIINVIINYVIRFNRCRINILVVTDKASYGDPQGEITSNEDIKNENDEIMTKYMSNIDDLVIKELFKKNKHMF